jgi:hypothetical protein
VSCVEPDLVRLSVTLGSNTSNCLTAIVDELDWYGERMPILSADLHLDSRYECFIVGALVNCKPATVPSRAHNGTAV